MLRSLVGSEMCIRDRLYPSYIDRQKRALPFLVAKLIAGISTIATSKIFTFLQTVTAFASFGQLLDHAHSTYGNLPSTYKSTPQMKSLFEATNVHTRQPRFSALTADSDLALGDYTKSLIPYSMTTTFPPLQNWILRQILNLN